MVPTRASSSRRLENDQPLKKNRNAKFSSRVASLHESLRDDKPSLLAPMRKNKLQNLTDVVVVRESKLKQAIVLLSKHLELMNCVNILEVIGPLRIAHTHSLGIRPHFHSEVEKEGIKLNDERSHPLDTYMALMTLLCPNIKAMSLLLGIQKSFAGIYDLLPIPFSPLTKPSNNGCFKPATPFHPLACPIFHDKLESLTLTQCRGWASLVHNETMSSAMQSGIRTNGPIPITLRDFKRWCQLDVPMDFAFGDKEIVSCNELFVLGCKEIVLGNEEVVSS
ncbi:hypothetical protein HBH69_185800 [Parastagonospora nodorum]|nr:hypothetical protein HBI76_190370 [Parastagonospora nodorum]KAH5145265.1 hypothetical protein HBH69_185800 [Parastagonospora nodorum]KAH5301844.1 hypothetical protein HBI12_185220 [Parastagonospora nodorum]KAH5409118.1 hypothetical protein HBI47_168530 [Parastagonospora nodorum]KAH5444607.1 hypothetical protein HBI30_207280 [Parastagonospora nodorum]